MIITALQKKPHDNARHQVLQYIKTVTDIHAYAYICIYTNSSSTYIYLYIKIVSPSVFV